MWEYGNMGGELVGVVDVALWPSVRYRKKPSFSPQSPPSDLFPGEKGGTEAGKIHGHRKNQGRIHCLMSAQGEIGEMWSIT